MNEKVLMMRQKWLDLIASTGATRGRPAPQAPSAGTFQHFETEEQRQEHNKQVADALARGEIQF